MEFAKLHFNFSKRKVQQWVTVCTLPRLTVCGGIFLANDIIYNKNFENVFCMEWSFFKCKTFITILKLTLGFKVFSHCQFFLDRKILLLPFVPLKNFFCFIYHHNSFWTCESLTSRTKHVLPSTTNVKIYKINWVKAYLLSQNIINFSGEESIPDNLQFYQVASRDTHCLILLWKVV